MDECFSFVEKGAIEIFLPLNESKNIAKSWALGYINKMEIQLKMLSLVRNAAKKKILFLAHAVRQMSRIDRMISAFEVRQVIEKGELIEDYPEDVRGHSCLILGYGNNNEMYAL